MASNIQKFSMNISMNRTQNTFFLSKNRPRQSHSTYQTVEQKKKINFPSRKSSVIRESYHLPNLRSQMPQLAVQKDQGTRIKVNMLSKSICVGNQKPPMFKISDDIKNYTLIDEQPREEYKLVTFTDYCVSVLGKEWLN